jgi:hypothetical protein
LSTVNDLAMDPRTPYESLLDISYGPLEPITLNYQAERDSPLKHTKDPKRAFSEV